MGTTNVIKKAKKEKGPAMTGLGILGSEEGKPGADWP